MIYGAVKAIREWATPLTPLNFAVLGLASGSTLAAALAAARHAVAGAPAGVGRPGRHRPGGPHPRRPVVAQRLAAARNHPPVRDRGAPPAHRPEVARDDGRIVQQPRVLSRAQRPLRARHALGRRVVRLPAAAGGARARPGRPGRLSGWPRWAWHSWPGCWPNAGSFSPTPGIPRTSTRPRRTRQPAPEGPALGRRAGTRNIPSASWAHRKLPFRDCPRARFIQRRWLRRLERLRQ